MIRLYAVAEMGMWDTSVKILVFCFILSVVNATVHPACPQYQLYIKLYMACYCSTTFSDVLGGLEIQDLHVERSSCSLISLK